MRYYGAFLSLFPHVVTGKSPQQIASVSNSEPPGDCFDAIAGETECCKTRNYWLRVGICNNPILFMNRTSLILE